MTFLKHIQNKSSNVKAQYSFFIAFFITLVIAVVWSTTLPARLSNIELITEDADEITENTKNLADVFNDAKSQAGNIIDWKLEDGESVPETNNLDALGVFNEQVEPEVKSNEDDYERSIDDSFLPENDEVEELAEDDGPRTVLIEIKKSTSD